MKSRFSIMSALTIASDPVPQSYIELQLSWGMISKVTSLHDSDKDAFTIQISADHIGNNYMRNLSFYSRYLDVYAFHAWINHAKWFIVQTTGVVIDGGEAFHKAIVKEAAPAGPFGLKHKIPDCFDTVVIHHHMWWFLKAGWQNHSTWVRN